MDDNLVATTWSLGIIEQLHPGPDNKIRVLTLRTPHGTIRCSITKISPIPILILLFLS